MRSTASCRLAALVACHLLVAFMLVDGSTARRLSLISTSAVSHSLRHASSPSSQVLPSTEEGKSSLNRDHLLSGVAFLHRARCVSQASYVAHDESSASLQNINSGMNSLLSIRGGASPPTSPSNNAVQSAIKSIMASSLPESIKKFIVMTCLFIENLTGMQVLPLAEEKRKSKSKKSRSREKEVLVEEVSVGTKKKRRSKRSSEEEVEVAVAKKRKRKSPKAEPAAAEEPQKSVEATTPEKAVPAATPAKPKPKRPDAASKKFLSNKMKSSNPNYRIQRELKEFLSSPPPGLSVKISGKNVRLWVVTFTMPDNTIYAGEKYRLRVQFPNDYPTSPPSVYFLNPTPRHEHVYTNGDICLSLLGKDWRPIMTAQSIAGSIMSILCGAQRKSLPMDNARHAGSKPGQKQNDWVYHDDNC